MTEHHRSDDFTIGTLVAELKAHREEYRRDRDDASAWRSGMEERTKTMEEFVSKMNTPLRIVWGCISVAGVTLVGGFCTWVFHWFGKHWNP